MEEQNGDWAREVFFVMKESVEFYSIFVAD